MSFGLDYVKGPPVASLKSGGVTFVCRYLSFVNNLTQVKLLSPAEAKALGAAGIAIVSNYEWYADRALEGAASGAADAHIAASQHANCGGSGDRPIYFSVDVDVAGSQVIDYFKGVASVIGLHRTGAYGSYRVLQELFDAGAITWGWQTYAWSYGHWEPRAHIQQYQNGMTMAGLSVDYDRSIKSDFGQWNPVQPQPQERNTWMSTGQEHQAELTWAIGKQIVPILFPGKNVPADNSGIKSDWQHHYMNGLNLGYAVTPETPYVGWDDKPIIAVWWSNGYRTEWDGAAHVYDQKNQRIA